MREEYNLKECVFGTEDYLCHYTSFANLCSILSTMTIRISSFSKSNDIGELESNISCIWDSNKEKAVERFIENHCGYISFSTTPKNNIPHTHLNIGYLIPSMWGIYADKSQGACLVISEEALINVNNQILSKAQWSKFLDVSYTPYQGSKLTNSKDSCNEITFNLFQHILGTKHYSWSYEQERRLIGVDLPPTLSLKNDVIRGVIIGKRVSLKQKEVLLSTLNDFKNACYHQIDKRIFVRQEILGGNVYTSDYGTYF